VVFEHLNGLVERGHHPELWTLGEPPDWFDLRVPVRSFETYDQLAAELAPLEALKVATWWNTADAVWRASVRSGIPVYLVQDLETSYYSDPDDQGRVLNSYRHEFRYLTTSQWVSDRLRELSVEPVAIPPGVDLDTFGPLEASRHERALLALARSNPLKNFGLTRQAFQQLPEPRPELWLFGVEPEIGSDIATLSYEGPSDAEVNGLLNRATAFVQTSTHEGFCLPILEAMATGLPVVCTDAHGNRDFCRDGENCLIPDATPRAVADALQRVLGDAGLRERLAAAGRETAERYGWRRQLDEIERFYEGVAG
jgi:glycosyltransferase involved in cell wall biosynthesis